MGLLVPGRSSRGVRDSCLLLVSKQRDYKTTAPKRRRSPRDRPLRPMPLRLEAQALTNLSWKVLSICQSASQTKRLSARAAHQGRVTARTRDGAAQHPMVAAKPPFVLQTHARRAEVPPSWTGRKSSSRAAAGHAARRLLRTVARRGPKPVSS